MKKLRKNMFGFTHHALLGVLVIAVVAFAGIKTLTGTHALTDSTKNYVEGYVHHNGSPVANAYFTINPWTLQNSDVTTNSAGHYKFYSAAKQVSVKAGKMANHCLELTSKTYTVEPTSAGTRQDFTLTKSHSTCFAAGFVTLKDGASAFGAVVTLKDKTTSATSTDKAVDASFSFPLSVDNSYSLSASLTVGCKVYSSDPQTFSVGSGWANPPMYIKLTNTKSTC